MQGQFYVVFQQFLGKNFVFSAESTFFC